MDENKTKKYFGVRYSIALGMKGIEGNLRDAGLFTISRDSSLKSPPKSSPAKQRYSLFSKSWLSPKKPEVNNELIAGLGEFKRELKQCMDDEKYHSQNNYKREKQFVRGSEMYEILFHSIPLVSLPEENRGNMRAKLVSVYHNLEATAFVTFESANVTKTIVASKLFELGTTSLSDKTTIQVDLDKNFLCYKIAPNCELLCAIYGECNSETGEEKLFLGFYKYPSMEVYDLIGPIEGVSWPAKQSFEMHFSYLDKEKYESSLTIYC